MKVDFEQEIKTLNGESIPATDGKPAVLRGVAVDALLAVFADEQQLAGEEKLKRYLLAEKIHNGGVEFNTEEIALVKRLIGKAFTPVVVGQAWQMLEGRNGFE